MAKFLGSSDSLFLFTQEDMGVVVDSTLNTVVASGKAEVLAKTRSWRPSEFSASVEEIANEALSFPEDSITASGSRMYTIPKGVKAEAIKALEWRKEEKRGGTPVGLNTARTLAKGGQIGIEKVRHIAKYFPRHEVDKKGKGWNPSEDGFPSNGRIAWALWGGDAAQRWASAIVERENKAAITADGSAFFSATTTGPELADFERSFADTDLAPEFLARVHTDGSGFDRLYMVDTDNRTYVWDDAQWATLGLDDTDIWGYDAALDGVAAFSSDLTHLVVDPQSAVFLAAKFMEAPGTLVSIEDIDSTEAALVAGAILQIDWALLDRAIVAAVDADGNYTPEERSENASEQIRDASGQFATVGNKVVVAEDMQNGIGTISAVDQATGKVTVALDNGNSVELDVAQVRSVTDEEIAAANAEVTPIDTSGILGEPRTPINREVAQIPGTLPAMTQQDLGDMLANWPAWVKSQRDAFKAAPQGQKIAVQAKDSLDKGDSGRALEQKAGKSLETDAYDHPLLDQWLKGKNSQGYNNAMWYNPITAAGEAEVAVTPDTTDVQPIYMAIVDPDDPRAVLNVISLVPASDKSTAPMTYSRKEGEWTRDEKALADLTSPTPPPVVPLDSETLNDVLKQVDSTQGVTASVALAVLYTPALIAAGGADRNRGGAEKLRRYWTVGEGAAKIRWGTGGDWKRCVRQLTKYMGPRSKGYCALRHKEMNGFWPGDKKNLPNKFSYDGYTLATEESVLETSALLARKQDVRDRMAAMAVASSIVASAAIGEDKNVRTSSIFQHLKTSMPLGAKAFVKNNDATETVEVDINDLIPTQNTVNMSRVADVLDSDKPVEVWQDEDGMKLIDGHHRTAGAKLSGRSTVNANIYKRPSEMEAPEVEEVESDGAPVGSKFVIPLVIPEGLESGDGRKFKQGAIEWRELPLPLLWQIQTGSGHDGSVVVGRIDHMERTEDGIGNAYGVFDTGAYGQEAERLVREGFLRGVSADMDRFEAEEVAADDSDIDEEKNNQIKKDKIVINAARVMAVTIVPKPAFQECSIALAQDEEQDSQEETVIPDGIYVEDVDPMDAEAVVASGMIAGAIPNEPPVQWFGNPGLKEPTPLTVDDEGRVFGHIAAWHVDHIGMAFGTRPPRSRSNYGYFHTGVCRTAEGKDVPVGQLTLAGGHASITADAAEAVKHYDDTASAIADVHAGEDAYGIWVAGALRPGTTPDQIRALRASAPSGDWRPIKGSLELVAVCQVNVPGFPIARARVASGQVMALVAAGAHTLAKMRSNPIEELSARLEQLEAPQKEALLAAAEAAKAKFAELRSVTADAYGFVDEAPVEDLYHDVHPTLVPLLEQLLADVVTLSFKAQGYHWNVKGEDFHQYHEFFGEIYSDVYGSVDPIAENIRKLGYDAPANLGTFASTNTIGNEMVDGAGCHSMAYDLYVANEMIVAELKNIFSVADAANEQGIADFIAGRIDTHQKWGWQLKASALPSDVAPMEYEVVEEEPFAEFFSAEAVVASAEERVSRVEVFAALVEFATFTEEQRKDLAKKGQALKDGSYPIRNEADLKNAIRAIGRADKAKRAAVKKHILKRAKALGATKFIPETWGLTASVDDLRSRIAEFSAGVEDSKKA